MIQRHAMADEQSNEVPIGPEELKKLNDWLLRHRKGAPLICQVCSTSGWETSKTVVELRPFRRGALGFGGEIYPMVLVTCSTCGNTLHFNAILAGLVDLPKPPEQEGKDG